MVVGVVGVFLLNRMQTRSQAGYCENEYANFSMGTNTVAIGAIFKTSPHSNHNEICCDPVLKDYQK